MNLEDWIVVSQLTNSSGEVKRKWKTGWTIEGERNVKEAFGVVSGGANDQVEVPFVDLDDLGWSWKTYEGWESAHPQSWLYSNVIRGSSITSETGKLGVGNGLNVCVCGWWRLSDSCLWRTNPGWPLAEGIFPGWGRC